MTQIVKPATRRAALAGASSLGLSLLFLGPALGADDIARRKLIVVICRGAMDGLSVSPPVGDRNYEALRGAIAIPGFGAAGGALKLDETFGLHPALATVHRLALAKQARIAPAIATTDRARSHFEAQDVLEAGVTPVTALSSGWLNRAVAALAPRKVGALAVGAQQPLILRGPVQAASWSPGGSHTGDDHLLDVLRDLYAKDPVLAPALASGLDMATAAEAMQPMRDAPDAMQGAMGAANAKPQAGDHMRSYGKTLATLIAVPGGPSVAALSLDGFDTHVRQGASQGILAQKLAQLDGLIDGLVAGLGPAWQDSVVLVVTEFGRTARMNGNGGTDHGTASTALLLGGAVKPGGIIGDWPTLDQNRLFENRDTAPTIEMRALCKGVLAGQLGIGRSALDNAVFPDSAAVAPLANLIA